MFRVGATASVRVRVRDRAVARIRVRTMARIRVRATANVRVRATARVTVGATARVSDRAGTTWVWRLCGSYNSFFNSKNAFLIGS